MKDNNAAEETHNEADRTADDLVLPGGLRQHEVVRTDRLDDIRHVADGHRGDHLGVEVGLRDNRQIDFIAGFVLISTNRRPECVVLRLVIALGPPRGDRGR